MARNEEKQLARLNRFYLQKDKEEYLKKNPPRPKLDSLTSAAAIQKWLPSIKRDLDFYIKQSMVPCYPESTIQQFSHRIDSLKREYKAFLLRLKEFIPDLQDTPWTDRPYAGQKRESPQLKDSSSTTRWEDEPSLKKSKCIFKPLPTPILHNDSSLKNMYGFADPPVVCYNVCKHLEDKPLIFSQGDISSKHGKLHDSDRGSSSNSLSTCSKDTIQHPLKSEDSHSDKQMFQEETSNFCGDVSGQCVTSCHSKPSAEFFSAVSGCTPGSVIPSAVQCSLSLPYSDSEDNSDS